MDYFNIYKDVWNFHKKYHNVQVTNEYWQAVASESNSISKKYNDCQFVMNLLRAVLDELNRIYKEMKTDADRIL